VRKRTGEVLRLSREGMGGGGAGGEIREFRDRGESRDGVMGLGCCEVWEESGS